VNPSFFSRIDMPALLGYMTARRALADGFTHHGRYFGIPVWMGDIEDAGPTVAAKWAPLDFLIVLVHHIEGALASWMFPDAEPMFQFLLGPAIELGNASAGSRR
jgi:hypothetical protein